MRFFVPFKKSQEVFVKVVDMNDAKSKNRLIDPQNSQSMQRSLAAAAAKTVAMPPADLNVKAVPPQAEIGGPKGPEPTRYGDWERKGRCIDF